MNKEKIKNIITFKEKSSYYILTGVVAATLLSCGALYKTSLLEDTAYNGVSIGSISVGGLNSDNIIDLLNKNFDELSNEKIIKLNINNKEISYSLKELGVTFNINDMAQQALSANKSNSLLKSTISRYSLYFNPNSIPSLYAIDENKIEDIAQEIIKTYSVKASNVKFEYGDNKLTVIENEKEGFLIDQSNLTSQLKNGIINAIKNMDKPQSTTLNQATNEIENKVVSEIINVEGTIDKPVLTSDTISKMTILGSYSSQLPSMHTGRGKNVILYANKLNNIVLAPNEEFSVVDRGGDISIETGYFNGGTFINGELVDSIGGGVCQVVSTLYNSTLYADLDITERHQHSLTVGYVPLGRDATMYPGSKDFKFVNNTENPIIINTYVTNSGKVIANIWGVNQHPEKKIEISTKTIGPLNVQTFKHTYENGVLVKTEHLHTDKYKK